MLAGALDEVVRSPHPPSEAASSGYPVSNWSAERNSFELAVKLSLEECAPLFRLDNSASGGTFRKCRGYRS